MYWPSVLVQMKRATPWRMKMNLAEDFVNIGNHFPSTSGRPEAFSTWRDFEICSTSSWWHQLDCCSGWIWWPPCFKERLGSWTWRNSWRCLQMCWWPWLEVLSHAYQAVLEGRNILDCFAESRTVLIPKTFDTDDLGRIIRSPDALRPLTLCNCDCKLLTSAVCRGLHWYTMQCLHLSQWCISTRQMTDNSSRLRPLPWPMSRVLRKKQVFSWLTLPLHIPVFITPGSSRCSRTQDCPTSSAAFFT